MVKVQVYNKSNNPLPKYETEFAAGCDVRSTIDTIIYPNERKLIPTGLHVAIPVGYEIQVRPRSGLAFKNGITVLNTPGTIDSDFIGEIGVILINHDIVPFEVKAGDRIGQLVLNKVEQIDWVKVDNKDDLPKTDRGEGGFGSTKV